MKYLLFLLSFNILASDLQTIKVTETTIKFDTFKRLDKKGAYTCNIFTDWNTSAVSIIPIPAGRVRRKLTCDSSFLPTNNHYWMFIKREHNGEVTETETFRIKTTKYETLVRVNYIYCKGKKSCK